MLLLFHPGTCLTGALFFKQGVNLYVAQGGMVKGSDDCSDYPICETRIEGESCLYFSALINADELDGFVMCGLGTVDWKWNALLESILAASQLESKVH